jgi:hypothetical protein
MAAHEKHGGHEAKHASFMSWFSKKIESAGVLLGYTLLGGVAVGGLVASMGVPFLSAPMLFAAMLGGGIGGMLAEKVLHAQHSAGGHH